MQYNCTRITLAFYMYKIVIVNGPLLQRYETKKKSVCWMIHEVPPPQVGQWTLCPQTHNAVERHINFWTREFQGEQWNFKSWCIHFVIAYYNSNCLFSQLFGSVESSEWQLYGSFGIIQSYTDFTTRMMEKKYSPFTLMHNRSLHYF